MIITYDDFHGIINIKYYYINIEIIRYIYYNINDIFYYSITYYVKEYENEFESKSLAIIHKYYYNNDYKMLLINYNDIFMIYKVKYFIKIINLFYLHFYNKRYSCSFNLYSSIYIYKKHNRLINYKVNNYIYN